MTKHPDQNRYQKTPKGRETQRRWRESPKGRAFWAAYRAAHRAEARDCLRRYLALQRPLRDALRAAMTAMNNVNDARAGIHPSKANSRLASELAAGAAALNSLIQGARP